MHRQEAATAGVGDPLGGRSHGRSSFACGSRPRSRGGRRSASAVWSSTFKAASRSRSVGRTHCSRSCARPAGRCELDGGSAEEAAGADGPRRSRGDPYGRFVRGSSIVGSASRSRCTLSTKSSSSVFTTRSFALRRSRSRRRRASTPIRSDTLGHSAATTTRTPRASRTIHGQLTSVILDNWALEGDARGLDSRARVTAFEVVVH